MQVPTINEMAFYYTEEELATLSVDDLHLVLASASNSERHSRNTKWQEARQRIEKVIKAKEVM
jgi:hypothetical protein